MVSIPDQRRRSEILEANMPRRKKVEPEERVSELISLAEAVLRDAREAKENGTALRALSELRELYLAKSQIQMGVDAQKTLRTIADADLIAEVRRRGISLDQKVKWKIVEDGSPELPAAEAPPLQELTSVSRPETEAERHEQ